MAKEYLPLPGLGDAIARVYEVEEVKDPEHYVQYHVSVRIKNQFLDKTWTVIRRFSEFDKLHQVLKKAKFANLPALPPKTFSHKYDNDFLQQRREALDQYLSNLFLCPGVFDHEEVLEFIDYVTNVKNAKSANAARSSQSNNSSSRDSNAPKPKIAFSQFQNSGTLTYAPIAAPDYSSMVLRYDQNS